MPSKAAMAAVRELQGLSALTDEGGEDYATIIDAHFAPYLEAVEAVKAAMAAGYPMSADTVAEDEVIDALWQRTKDALAKIDAIQ